MWSISLPIVKQSLKWAWPRSLDLFKFWEIIDNISEMLQLIICQQTELSLFALDEFQLIADAAPLGRNVVDPRDVQQLLQVARRLEVGIEPKYPKLALRHPGVRPGSMQPVVRRLDSSDVCTAIHQSQSNNAQDNSHGYRESYGIPAGTGMWLVESLYNPFTHENNWNVLYNQANWSTQPCFPPGPLNRVPALIGWGKGGNVTSAGRHVTPCHPIWHVSSRSGEAVCKLLNFTLPLLSRMKRNNNLQYISLIVLVHVSFV